MTTQVVSFDVLDINDDVRSNNEPQLPSHKEHQALPYPSFQANTLLPTHPKTYFPLLPPSLPPSSPYVIFDTEVDVRNKPNPYVTQVPYPYRPHSDYTIHEKSHPKIDHTSSLSLFQPSPPNVSTHLSHHTSPHMAHLQLIT